MPWWEVPHFKFIEIVGNTSIGWHQYRIKLRDIVILNRVIQHIEQCSSEKIKYFLNLVFHFYYLKFFTDDVRQKPDCCRLNNNLTSQWGEYFSAMKLMTLILTWNIVQV